MFPRWSKRIQQFCLHKLQAFLLVGSTYIPSKFHQAQSKWKVARFIFWMCFPALLTQGALGISGKLQRDEHWPRGLTQQIPESILLFHGHSGYFLSEKVRCFSIGQRRHCCSVGRKRLWNPFTALRVTSAHFKISVSLILASTEPQVYSRLQSLNQQYPALLAGKVHISSTCSFL